MALSYKYVLPGGGYAENSIVKEMFDDVKAYLDSFVPSGGAAPIDAKYVTLATNATLTQERVLTAGTGITLTDNGAGGTLVVSLTNGIGVTDIHGTASQITVSGTTGSVTLSLPQNIATSSAPTFAQMLLSGGTSAADLTLSLHDINNGFYADGATILEVVVNSTIAAQWDFTTFQFWNTGPIQAGSFKFRDAGGSHPTVTIIPPAGFTSYSLTLPVDDGTANQVLTTDGSGILSWTTQTGSGTVNTGTANRLAYYAASTAAVSALSAITANRAVISDANGLPTHATTTATEIGYVNGVTSAIQTQFGTKAPLASPTFTGTVTTPNIAITDTTNQLVLGTTRTVTITAPTPATSSRTWTIPDITANGTFAALEGTQTFTGAKTFSALLTPSAGIKGISTNTDATAGNVGEYIYSTVLRASAVSSTGTNQWVDITSITLGAGDWDVTGLIGIINNAGASTYADGGISTTSGNSSTGLVQDDTYSETGPATAAYDQSTSVPNVRISVTTSTTVYLKFRTDWTVNATKGFGRISARRVQPGS